MTTPQNPFGNNGEQPNNGSENNSNNQYGGNDGAYPSFPNSSENTGDYGQTGAGDYSGNYYGSTGAEFTNASKPNNYMPWSIILTVLTLCSCCIPFGVIPLVFSFQVNNRWQEGNMPGAQQSAKNARMACMIVGGLLVLYWVVSLILYFAGVTKDLYNVNNA